MHAGSSDYRHLCQPRGSAGPWRPSGGSPGPWQGPDRSHGRGGRWELRHCLLRRLLAAPVLELFVGIGTGTCFVAGARYISEAVTGTRRHVAQGLYGWSILLGSGFVIMVVPRLVPRVGWRGAFLVTADWPL